MSTTDPARYEVPPDDPAERPDPCRFDPDDRVVAIDRIRLFACPVATPPWRTVEGCIHGEVLSAIASGEGIATPVAHTAPRRDHVRRIAWLATNGWPDPILIDVGVPGMGGFTSGWIVVDGNHRLYAAIVRGDTGIATSLGGSVRTLEEMFNVSL